MGAQRSCVPALGILICIVDFIFNDVHALVQLGEVSPSFALASLSSSRALQVERSSPPVGVTQVSSGDTQVQADQSTSPELATAITIVNSANDLFLALRTGARHVDLRSHVDLSTRSIYDPVDLSEPLLPDVMARTTSITGTCDSLPSEAFLSNVTGAPLLALKSSMCMILADADVFSVKHGNLWLDNLYLRATSGSDVKGARDQEVEMLVVVEEGQVWMSNVFMQGSGNDTNVAVDAQCSVHGEDCTFADFGPKATPVRVDGSHGAAVFERCRFKVAGNLAEGQEHAEAMVSSFTGAAVYVRNCTFQNTPGHLSSMLQMDEQSCIYSDEQMGVDAQGAGGDDVRVVLSEPVQNAPDSVSFLSSEDPWILQMRDEVQRRRNGEDSSSGGGRGSTSLIVGIAAGVAISVVLTALSVALVLAFHRLKRRTRNSPQASRHEENSFGLRRASCEGSPVSPGGSTFPAWEDDLGSYGMPHFGSGKGRSSSPRRTVRGSSFGTRSMHASTQSWHSGYSSQKGASSSHGAASRASGTRCNRGQGYPQMHTHPEDVSEAGSSASGTESPVATLWSNPVHEQHASEIHGVAPSDRLQSRSPSAHAQSTELARARARARALARPPPSCHACASERGRLTDCTPASSAGVQLAEHSKGSLPPLLARAMADMSLSTSQGGSSDAPSGPQSAGGSSAALLAESQSRSWHVSYTYLKVQGAAAAQRARSQARSSPPRRTMVQRADNHTWMGSYDHSKALRAADLELQRSIASLASSSRTGGVPTHARAHAHSHATLSPRQHARSPNPVAVSPPPSPRRRSRGLSRSQASYSHSQDGSTTPHAARGHLRRDAGSQSRGLSHSQRNHTPEVFRSGMQEVEERLEAIKEQLANTGPHYQLKGLHFKAGPKSRLQGGQAIVQFATDKNSESDYAIKFFATREAFADEAALYRGDAEANPLAGMLPVVRDIISNQDGSLTDGAGQPLPPCIVMEKGEALNIWSRRNKGGLDHMTALQVLCHIADRLADLHSAGYVHRDLKQSNVMWQPQCNRWTLIDFGLVTRIGQPAKIGFSLGYAAPEVVIAFRRGEPAVIASEAMDAWSLGVLAVELFTNDVGLDLMQGTETVMSQLVGETALPWEDARWAPSLLRKFGLFKEVCLELLHRDPCQRPTMREFIRNCRHVLALTKSQP